MSGPILAEVLTARLLWDLRRRRRALWGKDPRRTLHVLYRVTQPARALNGLLGALGGGFSIQEHDFDFYDDVKPLDGSSIRTEFLERAPWRIARRIEEQPGYGQAIRMLVRNAAHEPYVRAYLLKRVVFEMSKRVRCVLTAGWLARERLGSTDRATLLTPHTWAWKDLSDYAAEQGVRIQLLGEGSKWEGVLFQLLRRAAWALQGFAHRNLSQGLKGRVAVELYLGGTRTEGPFHSDLFWFRPGLFPDGVVLGYFRHPKDQPGWDRAARLRRSGIQPLGRRALAVLMSGPSQGVAGGAGSSPGEIGTILRRYLTDFYREYDRWIHFCRRTGVRIHVSGSDQFPESEALHAAFRDAGGLCVSIQRSIEREARFFRRTIVDLHFGFCRANADTEEESGSRVGQFIVAGYPFDAAFVEGRARGVSLRARLAERGVRFVICYLDENDGIQPKRLGGRRQIRNDYRFLCGKVAADPELGLILKPKRSETLRARLGPVWGEIQELIESGRCILLGGEGPEDSLLPCAGSAGADVAINALYGATAGLESRLIGIPTLLIGYGMERGLFSQLPAGTVIFDDWQELWEGVERLRRGGKESGVGDWGPVLDQLAELRDGCGMERIREVIQDLWRALSAGASAEGALQEISDRYRRRWGEAWVQAIPAGKALEKPPMDLEAAALR